MIALLQAIDAKPVRVTACHTLTLAALLARGAVAFKVSKGRIDVIMTDAGIDLYNWLLTADVRDYKTKALPEAQTIKTRKSPI